MYGMDHKSFSHHYLGSQDVLEISLPFTFFLVYLVPLPLVLSILSLIVSKKVHKTVIDLKIYFSRQHSPTHSMPRGAGVGSAGATRRGGEG